MKPKLKNLKACPECGSANIKYSEDKDTIICRDCGDIFSELTPEQEKKFENVSEVIN